MNDFSLTFGGLPLLGLLSAAGAAAPAGGGWI